MKKIHLPILLLIFLGIPYSFAFSSSVARTQHAEIELIPQNTSFIRGKTNTLLFQMKLQEGWHTYWKNPGDSGLPIQLDWKLPSGFQIVKEQMEWPVPERINIGGVINFGYHDTVLLLIPVKVPFSAPQNITIALNASWLICEKICIPEKSSLSLSLPVSSTEETKNNSTVEPLFEKAKAALPSPLKAEFITLTQYQNSFLLEIQKQALDPYEISATSSHISELDMFSESEGILNNNQKPLFSWKENGNLQIQVFKNENASEIIKSSQLKNFLALIIMQIDSNKFSFQFAKKIAPTVDGAPKLSSFPATSSESKNIFILLLFAFIGGLILNLMPCVFPILAIKIMHVVEQSHASNKSRILHALLYSTGVILSFLFLSTLLIVLRISGEQIGWGFQLQSPVFIFSLCILLYLMALNLIGYYEISSRFSGVGDSLTRGSSFFASFCTGALAVIAATPCTAPFMGTAIGIALSQSILHSFFVFFFLGLGMATPYILLAAAPNSLRFLPKPGAWMQTLKEILAFPLLATVIWLLWILNQQAGSLAVSTALITLLLFTFALWIQKKIRDKNLSKFIFLFICIFSAYLAWGIREFSQKTTTLEWEKFSEHLVEKYKNENRYIFIDYTADWCITCKVNEKITFPSKNVVAAFKRNNVALLRADWTSYDPEITQSLKKYNRAGVPLYLLFIPGKEDPEILPQIILPQHILEYLK